MQALINLGLIDKKTSNTYFARAMHAFLDNRTEGSIRSGCNRYDVSPHVLSDENMISDIQKVLQPVVDAMRAWLSKFLGLLSINSLDLYKWF